VQKAGDNWRVTTESLTTDEVAEVQQHVSEELDIPAKEISAQVVGSTWGGDVSEKAWLALAVFMLLIVGYLSLAF